MLFVTFPLYVICRFSLFAFNNFSLSLIFVNLITVCLGVFLLGFILPGTLCASWTLVAISFHMLGKFSTVISSDIFSGPLSLSSPSGTPIMRTFLRLMLSQKSLRLFSFFFLYSVSWQWIPPFCLPGHLSVLLPQLFCYWFLIVYFSFLLLYCSSLVCLFFNSSRCFSLILLGLC